MAQFLILYAEIVHLVQPSWSSLVLNMCGDIYDNQGLCSFQTLRNQFCLPASAYFGLSSMTFCSQSVWCSLGLLPFPSSYAGLDCTICWSAICFLNRYNTIIDCIANLFLLKLFGIGNYLTLIYLSTGRGCGLISA